MASALAALCALAGAAGGQGAGSCAAETYSYAGVISADSSHGVSALIRPLRRPLVHAGHVAAWVGVGGEGWGPHGTAVWLQVGLSAKPNGSVALYFELALPGKEAQYVMLKGHVPVDLNYRVAVLATKQQPGWWTVFVNGRRATRPIELPGSRGGWRPMVTTESWNGLVGVCNTYAFRFSDVTVADHPGGGWQPFDEAHVLSTPGARVTKDAWGYVGAGGRR